MKGVVFLELNFLFLGMRSGTGSKSGKHFCMIDGCWVDLEKGVVCTLFVSDPAMESALSKVETGTKFSCVPRDIRASDSGITFFV